MIFSINRHLATVNASILLLSNHHTKFKILPFSVYFRDKLDETVWLEKEF